MRPVQKKPLHVAAAVVAALAVLEIWLLPAIGIKRFPVLAPLENRVLDLFVRKQAAELAPDRDIVIVAIDDTSLTEMQDVAGSWQWPRSVHGELVAGLAAQKPKAIVFDILFSEPDLFRLEHDRVLNDALDGLTNVYFSMSRLPQADDAEGAPIAKLAQTVGIHATARARPDTRVRLLLPEAIDQKHWRLGLIDFLEDRDGVGRRYYLRQDVDGWEIPSLPARVAQDLGYEVPDGESILLAWRGGVRAFEHVSFSDLHQDFGRKERKRPPDEFRDKIVIIGATATGLYDLRVTPIASLYPGVQIIATALDNLKNRRWMARAPAIVPAVLAFALIGLLFVAFRRRWNATQLAATLAAVSALLLAASYGAAGRLSLVPVFEPLVFAWAFFFAASLIEYLREKRTREQAVELFSRFLNPQVVSRLVDQGATPESLSGQEKEVTVLFSDIRGFTAHSEAHTPGEIVALLNRYFSRQVEVIFRHGGTLDKFIGDCIMAFWGAPVERPDHARAAVAAALEMVEVLQAFKRELAAQGSDIAEAFDVGIGLHSGRAVVGFIGAERKLDYTAIGDTVNLASRIEGLTRGVSRVLVSRDTVEACGSAFDFAPRGSYKVKGRTQEVELFEPMPKSA
jgi:adenylate cyclase